MEEILFSKNGWSWVVIDFTADPQGGTGVPFVQQAALKIIYKERKK
jgi:hypothetical protein